MPLAALLEAAALTALIAAALTRGGRQAMATMAATVAGWWARTLVVIAPSIALEFAAALLTAFRLNTDKWRDVVTLFVEELTGGAAAAVGAGGGGSTSGVSLAQLVNVRPLVDAVLQTLTPAGELTPESGQTGMQNLLGLNIALAIQGWWVEAAGDIVSLGKFGAAADLPDAIERALGLNRMTRLIWRAVVKAAIADPLTELYNRRYTFKKLTIGEAHQAWHRGLIDDPGYLDAAAAAGYSHDRAAVLLQLAAQSYSTAEVVDLARYLGLTDEMALPLLREAGWDSSRAATLLELSRKRQEQTILNEAATLARSLFKTGRIDAEQLGLILDQAHYTDTEKGLILAVEGLARGVEKTLSVAELLAAYKEGIEDGPTTRGRLQKLGYQDPDIDILLALQHRVLSVSQILALLTQGRLTIEEATRRLQAQGYGAAEAALLVSLRGRRLTEGQVLDALRQGLISVGLATQDLEQLGYDVDQVTILLAFQAKALSPGDVQAALLRGLLTPDEATQRLLRLGFSPDDAAILVELRRRLLTVGQILDAYGDGFLGRADALGDLAQRGYSPDDALTLVRAFELKRETAAQRAALATARAARAVARPPVP